MNFKKGICIYFCILHDMKTLNRILITNDKNKLEILEDSETEFLVRKLEKHFKVNSLIGKTIQLRACDNFEKNQIFDIIELSLVYKLENSTNKKTKDKISSMLEKFNMIKNENNIKIEIEQINSVSKEKILNKSIADLHIEFLLLEISKIDISKEKSIIDCLKI